MTALRRCGVTVQSLAAVGQGVPDLLCATRACTFLVEVKDGAKPPSDRALTPDQVEWHHKWPGAIYVVTSAEEVPGVVISACRA